MTGPIVVKVGGSLFELEDLGPRLRHLLAELAAPVLLFPGGGTAADVIRQLDRTHALGEEAAHWLALEACTLNAHFLARLLPEAAVTTVVPAAARCAIVDALAFARDDERRPDHFPHRWDVTSDSMAMRVAHRAGADELILLKSIDWQGPLDEPAAASAEVVDPFFATALRLAQPLRARVINLRARRVQ